MKILSKDVHRILGENFSPSLKPIGFSALAGSSFAASCKTGGQFVTLWAQCDRHGWQDDWGSCFTIELQHAHEPSVASASMGQRARLCHLLRPDELEHVRQINNAIIAGLPGTVENKAIQVPDGEGGRVTVFGFTPATEPYPQGADVWYNYFTAEHVAAWADTLSQYIPAAMQRLLGKAG